jgi:hypothetical protein
MQDKDLHIRLPNDSDNSLHRQVKILFSFKTFNLTFSILLSFSFCQNLYVCCLLYFFLYRYLDYLYIHGYIAQIFLRRGWSKHDYRWVFANSIHVIQLLKIFISLIPDYRCHFFAFNAPLLPINFPTFLRCINTKCSIHSVAGYLKPFCLCLD